MLMYCAANGEKLSRVPEIARAYGVSELFLFKILQPLTRAGIIQTVRGRNGGVRLPRPASQITLFDVVRVTEVDSCGLNSALRKALNAFFEVLQQYTIDDLVKARPQIGMLLGLEPAVERKPAA
jgi:Rrf2 family iron-responsive transcriptional regulator